MKRVIRAWAVIDCKWGILLDVKKFRHRLTIPDCKDCFVGEVEIRPILKSRRKKNAQ